MNSEKEKIHWNMLIIFAAVSDFKAIDTIGILFIFVGKLSNKSTPLKNRDDV